MVGDPFVGEGLLGEGITAGDLDRTLLHVTSTEGETYGYTLEFIFGELPAGLLIIGIVVTHADTTALQLTD